MPGSILNPEPWEQRLLPLHDLILSQAEYESRISRIESEAGAFAYDLVPELIGLALLQREAGEHSTTVNLLQRAFYIVRINKGLYSPIQIPLLEMLIQSQGAMGRWKLVADEYDYLYWLYQRNYGSDDIRLLPFLKRLHQWHLDAYNKDTGRSLGVHFKTAVELYKKANAIILACGENDKVTRCFWDKDCCKENESGSDSCPVDSS